MKKRKRRGDKSAWRTFVRIAEALSGWFAYTKIINILLYIRFAFFYFLHFTHPPFYCVSCGSEPVIECIKRWLKGKMRRRKSLKRIVKKGVKEEKRQRIKRGRVYY